MTGTCETTEMGGTFTMLRLLGILALGSMIFGGRHCHRHHWHRHGSFLGRGLLLGLLLGLFMGRNRTEE
jgi:hypothetical protein